MYHGNHFRQVGSPENFRRENPTDPERIRTKINFGLDYSRNCVIIKLKSPQEGKSLMTAEFTFQVPAKEFDFIPFNRNLESFFAAHKLSQVKLFTIELIVEELVTNTQKYGGSGNIEIAIRLSVDTATNKITLQIRDNALPFDPSRTGNIDPTLSIEKREIGGLGLLLVQEKSESMKYEYRNHCNITTLTV